MKKVFIQLLVTIFIFFASWMVLSQVDWMSVFNVAPKELSLEEKLGETYCDIIREAEGEVGNDSLVRSVRTLLYHLCLKNDIDTSRVKLHVICNNQVNAFALPGGYMIVCQGLLDEVENDQELVGVLGHELAHIEKNHVMKKMIKEIGLSVLIGMTTDTYDGHVIKENLPVLTATAYDRKLEQEADYASVDYMINAGIDPEPFANLLYRHALNVESLPEIFNWIDSHPQSKDRAENIITYIKKVS